MSETRISDIPSFTKALANIRTANQFKQALPLLRPILKRLNIDVAKIEAALIEMGNLGLEIEALSKLPDRFNHHFAGRGWIIYDRMDLNVASAAITKAETGDVAGAEMDLVAYYSPEFVRRELQSMHSVAAFRPRMRLAECAAIDFEERRYHACIPVVLALMDGMVNELHQKVHASRRGISGSGVDLRAWDSIAAHENGLNRLVEIFQKTRNKTNTEALEMPYRNGIMHGTDLGYDNQIVATKVWAALFSVRDWAVRAEQSQIAPPPEEPAKSMKEIWGDLRASIQRINESNAARKQADAWAPRDLQIGINVPANGAPDVFGNETPERKLSEYLNYWSRKNYGGMAQCISPFMRPAANKAAARVRSEFAPKQLSSFTIKEIQDTSFGITDILTELHYTDGEVAVTKEHTFRMACMDSDEILAPPGVRGAEWGVVFWDVS